MAGPAQGAPVRCIVFAHANGFPAGTYRKIFEHWRAAGWTVSAPEKFGHDPAFPVTSNWPHLRDELLQQVQREVEANAGQAVYLVGHSLGGFLSLMAAVQRPELARGVVMLDSPIVAGWRAWAVHFHKATGVGKRFSPSSVSHRRRHVWPSAEAALDHFAGKAAFARWDPAVLRDYIEAGTEPHSDQRRLRFRREVETSIYDTLPHHMARLLHRHPLRCPVAFIGGTESAEVRQVGLAATKRLVRDRLAWVEGSHLYPMERPVETAERVLEALTAMQQDAV